MRKVEGVALYCRISSDPHGERGGVDRQEAECRVWADEHGWMITAVYVDNDVSAYSGKRRPGYERMLEVLDAGGHDGVLAWHPDRLHRAPRELERFIDVVEARGAQVATATAGHYDLSTPAGRMVARQLGAVARYESEHKSARIRAQRAQSAARGEWNGGRRGFGYEADGMTVRPVEAKLIREAAARYLAGESLRTVVLDWRARGVATSSGRQWQVSSLRMMLGGPRIAGLRVHQGDIVGEAQWPAILERPVWEQLRARLGDPREHRVGRPPLSLLGGLLRCGVCGARMHASTATRKGRKVRRYMCPGAPNGCGRISGRGEPFEAYLVEVAVAAIDSPKVRRRLGTRRSADTTGAGVELADVDRRLAELADLFASGEIRRAEWMRARAGLVRRRDVARALLARAATDVQALNSWTSKGAMRDVWPTLTVDEQRRIFTALFDRVVLCAVGAGRRVPASERVEITWAA